MQDRYFTVSSCSEGLYKDRGSRFLAFACPVYTENEVKDCLQKLKKQYHDARHHCYACRLGVSGELWRAVDDGEPSGTAGKPILGQLISHNLTNIAVFVVRYFGGVKLGVSGLINAYRSATVSAIQNAEIVEKEDKDTLFLEFDCLVINEVMKTLKNEHSEIARQELDMQCKMEIRIRRSLSEQLKGKLLKIDSLRVYSSDTVK
ncbi:MAG: YigZ family protein [Dysgonamonadaceae bacterium]|jgi:uncharacterized YigZ family protein|nr:YigZ family protein [Dysgonamonadaceae bacterium]